VGNEDVVIEKLLIKPVGMTMTMRADCNACKRKIVESPYESRHEYELKKEKWKTNIRECPFCGVPFRRKRLKTNKTIAWKRSRNEWYADVKNGTFYLFKWGKSWKWSFRYYNEKEPRAENQGSAFSKEVAERMCERHKEWMV
jgi:hypothetical protein